MLTLVTVVCKTMASVVTPELLKEHLLPTITKLGSDPIPNIRFNVAKSLEGVVPVIKKNPETAALIDSVVKPTLTKLSEDGDGDVRYFASKALNSIGMF